MARVEKVSLAIYVALALFILLLHREHTFSLLQQMLITAIVRESPCAFFVALIVLQTKFTQKFTTCFRRSTQETAEQDHTVPERQQMQWMSFSQHLVNLQKLEGCFPLLEQKRKLRRKAQMVRKWHEFAKLIPDLSESKSAGKRLLAESSKWKSRYRAVQSVDKERPHLLPCEKQLADTLIDRAGAIEDLREVRGCKDAWMLKKVRSYALSVGVQSSQEDMKYNAEELCKVLTKRAPILPKPLCPNFGEKLSMKKGTVSMADLGGGQLQVHFAKDGYVISSLPIIKGGLGELPQEAARKANVHDGPTLVSWVNWNASVADYESRRHASTVADDMVAPLPSNHHHAQKMQGTVAKIQEMPATEEILLVQTTVGMPVNIPLSSLDKDLVMGDNMADIANDRMAHIHQEILNENEPKLKDKMEEVIEGVDYDTDSDIGYDPFNTEPEVVGTGSGKKFEDLVHATFAKVENAFQSDVYEQNRRTVAWAYGQALARERRLEALCVIGRERKRSEMSEG